MRFTRDFYKPSNPTQVVERPEYQSVVYFTLTPQGKPAAIGFSGKRHKPDFSYRFETEEKRLEYVARYFTDLKANLDQKAKYREGRKESAKSFLERLKPGVILYDTWGYEQTNVEFYRVVSRKGSKVEIIELTCKSLEATGWASDRVVPGEPLVEAKSIWKQVRGSRIKICSSISLGIYEDHPNGLHRSWYA